MKKVVILILCMIMTIALVGCGHEHTWQEATCTSPKTCSECGETEGGALGHSWIAATCEVPETCSVCGATQGEANGHIWEGANCQHPEQCAVCGSTKNTQLGDHECKSWSEIVDPTCSEAGYKKGTCINCGQEFTVILEKTPHSFGEWEEAKQTSCAEPGEKKHICTVCEYEETEEIPLLEHELDEWKTIKEAAYNENGVRGQECLSCKNMINTEEFTFADTVKDKVEFKGDSEGLLITDVNLISKTTWGYINGEIVIEITNTNNFSVKISKANVDIVDNEGALLETIDEYSVFFVPAIIEPGQKGYVLCELFASTDELDASNGMDVKAYITAEKTNDKRSQWEFTDINTKGGDPETVGHIRNADKVPYESVRIYCLYRDTTGRVIGFTTAYENDQIAPDDTVSFGTYNSCPGLINGSGVVDVECIGVGYTY